MLDLPENCGQSLGGRINGKGPAAMMKFLTRAIPLAVVGVVSTTSAQAHMRHHHHHHHHHAHHHHHWHHKHARGFEQERMFTTNLQPYFDVREDHPGSFGPYSPEPYWPGFHHWNHM
jgi:hypothetical protein